MQQETERKLTAKELADVLGCHVSTVYRLKLNGRLPYVQPGGKGHMVRFEQRCLDRENTDQALPERPQSPSHSGPKPKWLAEYDERERESQSTGHAR
jgi:excisionase family DNA binding protein